MSVYTGLTSAQRRILNHLADGGQLWAVSSQEDPMDDPTLHYVVAVFHDGEFIHTEPVQNRTLMELRRRRLIHVEL